MKTGKQNMCFQAYRAPDLEYNETKLEDDSFRVILDNLSKLEQECN